MVDGFLLSIGRRFQRLHQDGLQGILSREHQGRRVPAVEEHAEVGAVGLEGVSQGAAGGLLEEQEALGRHALADAFQHDLPFLRHAQGGEAVEHGEGQFAGEAGDEFLAGVRFLFP